MTLLDMARLYEISSYVERISVETIRINFRHHLVPLQFQQTVSIEALINTPNLEDKICDQIYDEMIPYIRQYKRYQGIEPDLDYLF